MKTADQLYNESLERINTVDAITEISKKILEITNALYQNELKDWDGDKLSRAITSLAILRVNLGQEMANAVAYYDISYTYRKMRYASEWKPTKDKLNKQLKRATIQDIDSEIMQQIADEQEAELKNKHYAEQLRTLYDSTETLITAMQSRLGILKQEMYESRSHGA
jgi:vancomycin resistance protein YoaR